LNFRLQLILQCCLPAWPAKQPGSPAGSQLGKKPSSLPVRHLGTRQEGRQAGSQVVKMAATQPASEADTEAASQAGSEAASKQERKARQRSQPPSGASQPEQPARMSDIQHNQQASQARNQRSHSPSRCNQRAQTTCSVNWRNQPA